MSNHNELDPNKVVPLSKTAASPQQVSIKAWSQNCWSLCYVLPVFMVAGSHMNRGWSISALRVVGKLLKLKRRYCAKSYRLTIITLN